jgi:GTPase SAR1 family protein
VLKLLLIGDMSVGKSCLLLRFVLRYLLAQRGCRGLTSEWGGLTCSGSAGSPKVASSPT